MRKGGDLGLFEKELMVPEFDKAVFNMNVGDISDVVKTDYGYHIIKLNEIQPTTLQSFEEVEGRLLALHKKNVNQKELYNLQEELSNLAYEESIDVVSESARPRSFKLLIFSQSPALNMMKFSYQQHSAMSFLRMEKILMS